MFRVSWSFPSIHVPTGEPVHEWNARSQATGFTTNVTCSAMLTTLAGVQPQGSRPSCFLPYGIDLMGPCGLDDRAAILLCTIISSDTEQETTMAVISEAAYAAALELQDVRSQQAQLRKREEDLKKAIYAELGDSSEGMLASGVTAVHVEEQHRRSVNSAKLEAMYPGVYDDVMEEKITRVLRIDL
jgi:hypothetical protein